jgi:hypothetical protein
MNYLFYTINHLSTCINGAEVYHHYFAKRLQKQGHSAAFICHSVRAHTAWDGVDVYPMTHASRMVNEWCDAVISTPKIIGPLKCKKPVWYIQHNETKEPFDLSDGRVIYCAKHVAASVAYDCIESRIIYPPCRYEAVDEPINDPNGYYVLINCNVNKGGEKLVQLARQYPHREFVGVIGYGRQIRATLPNLRYIDPLPDVRDVLRNARAVLMPSDTEGMPNVALECMALGVPIYCSDIAAFRELGIAGDFFADFDADLALRPPLPPNVGHDVTL